MEREKHRLIVSDELAGKRLDRYLADALGTSRQRVLEAIGAGCVRVDGRRVRKGDPVQPGQTIEAELLPAQAPPVAQPELPLVVVYEDPDLVVVDKPSGWPTHPLVPGERGTLANALVARFPECVQAGLDVREGGVAHRLDTPTSGLVVAARNRPSWESLRRAFAERRVRKEYLALAGGVVEDRVEVRAPIATSGAGVARTVVEDHPGAREAHTLVEVECRFGGWTLVRCTISTGVMHQIRVHLAHLGAPIVGDERYGGPTFPGLDRLFLHATRLGFAHPRTGVPLLFESPLPQELAACLSPSN